MDTRPQMKKAEKCEYKLTERQQGPCNVVLWFIWESFTNLNPEEKSIEAVQHTLLQKMKKPLETKHGRLIKLET